MPKTLMNIAYEKSPLANPFQKFDSREFACGWGAAFINIICTYPLYKTIFRQMLHGVKIETAFMQLRHEGLSFLYRGMFPPLAQKTLSLSLMFGVYDGIKVSFNCFPFRQLNFIQIFKFKAPSDWVLSDERVCSEMPGWNDVRNLRGSSDAFRAGSDDLIRCCLSREIQKYSSRVQVSSLTTLKAKSWSKSFFNFRVIILENGMRELYRGLVPILLRNGPSNAVFFILREEAQKLPKGVSGKTSWLENKFVTVFNYRTAQFHVKPISFSRVLLLVLSCRASSTHSTSSRWWFKAKSADLTRTWSPSWSTFTMSGDGRWRTYTKDWTWTVSEQPSVGESWTPRMKTSKNSFIDAMLSWESWSVVVVVDKDLIRDVNFCETKLLMSC